MSTVLDSVNMRQNATQTPSRLTPIEWLICALACIGLAFDTYKVVVDAGRSRARSCPLGHPQPGSPAFNHWVGLLLYATAFAGGILALLGRSAKGQRVYPQNPRPDGLL